MLEGFILTPQVFIQGGAVVVLVWVFALVLTGRLVPKSQVDRMEKAHDEAISRERETSQVWKTSFDTAVQARQTQEQTLATAVEGLRTTEYIIRSLRGHGEGSDALALESQGQHGAPALPPGASRTQG